MTSKEAELEPEGAIFAGEMEKLDDISWKRFAEEFFEKQLISKSKNENPS